VTFGSNTDIPCNWRDSYQSVTHVFEVSTR